METAADTRTKWAQPGEQVRKMSILKIAQQCIRLFYKQKYNGQPVFATGVGEFFWRNFAKTKKPPAAKATEGNKPQKTVTKIRSFMSFVKHINSLFEHGQHSSI